MELRDGVLEFLDEIRLRNIKCGLITDLTANIQFRKLIRLGLEDKFDVITTSEEIGFDKPHPNCFINTINKLYPNYNENEHKIWMIGDDLDKDIYGAINNLNAKGFLYSKKRIKINIDREKVVVFDNYYSLIKQL